MLFQSPIDVTLMTKCNMFDRKFPTNCKCIIHVSIGNIRGSLFLDVEIDL